MLRRALQLQPGFALAAVDLALALLLAGKLEEGWAQYQPALERHRAHGAPAFFRPRAGMAGPAAPAIAANASSCMPSRAWAM
jgi:hypothetical protein